MIEHYFKNPQTWDRIRASWLSEPIQRYVTWLDRSSYSVTSICARVPLLLRFAEYTQEKGTENLDQLPGQVRPFLRWWIARRERNFSENRTRRQFEKELRSPIDQMLRLLLPEFASSKRDLSEYPFSDMAPGFVAYLIRDRGLSPYTVQLYSTHLRKLERFMERGGHATINELTPALLAGFITEWGKRLRKMSVAGVCAALRVFLRYAYLEKLHVRDLSLHVERPRAYKLSSIPRSIAWPQIQQMLNTVDRRSALGKRDYAMMLLLVAYGLRSREVALLTLDDINWDNDTLRVPTRKAGHSSIFPLVPAVGAALVEYLQDARPKTVIRRVFLTVKAPCRACPHSIVSGRASYYLRRAGIAVPRPGSHTLRHTCVQRMVDRKLPLKMIGDYIGHRAADSTMIYTKIDVEALREMSVHAEEIL